MSGERVERRLTAILAADVAGYSRLTGLDEEGTHARLQDHLRSLVDPKIAEHRGRVVKSTGDGLLAEFSSVVEAGRCADGRLLPTDRLLKGVERPVQLLSFTGGHSGRPSAKMTARGFPVRCSLEPAIESEQPRE